MIYCYLAGETAQAKEFIGFCKIYNLNPPFTHTMYNQYIILITFVQIDKNFPSSIAVYYRVPVGPVSIGSL